MESILFLPHSLTIHSRVRSLGVVVVGGLMAGLVNYLIYIVVGEAEYPSSDTDCTTQRNKSQTYYASCVSPHSRLPSDWAGLDSARPG